MTPRQKEILSHVVIDADAWYAHAVEHFGQQLADRFLAEKCNRWEPEYERERAKENYQPRAEREAKEKVIYADTQTSR